MPTLYIDNLGLSGSGNPGHIWTVITTGYLPDSMQHHTKFVMYDIVGYETRGSECWRIFIMVDEDYNGSSVQPGEYGMWVPQVDYEEIMEDLATTISTPASAINGLNNALGPVSLPYPAFWVPVGQRQFTWHQPTITTEDLSYKVCDCPCDDESCGMPEATEEVNRYESGIHTSNTGD